MTISDVVQRLVRRLREAGIPYMFTGSFASSFHGAARSSQDIDAVIAPTPSQLRAFVAALPDSEFYADVEAALDAHRTESQFNLVDLVTGWKVDLMIRRSRPFSIAEFERRLPVDVQGLSVFVVSLEDIVLAKLEWAKLGQSRRQMEDVAMLLRDRRGELDQDYMDRWIRELDLEGEWREALRQSQEGE